MRYYDKEEQFQVLKGKTLRSVRVSDDKDTIDFETTEGEVYRLYHSQDCCETVYVEDVVGDLSDLIGSPLLEAEEVSSADNPVDWKPELQPESYTWTFYKLATVRGSVTLRWLGESNGYYSESVSFCRM